MQEYILPVSSLAALVMLIVHCWLRRGGRVTAAFFIGGTIFGIARGNIVHFTVGQLLGTGTGGKEYLPQSNLLPTIGNSSLQVVIGWMFAAYLAWTLSEYVLRRLKGWHDRVFATLGLSAVFMVAISYCMETTAPHVHWWYWAIPTNNSYFGEAGIFGILAWFSIATDLLLPVLVIVCSDYRRSPWRWLALLVFPAHKLAHLVYMHVPGGVYFHTVMILGVVVLALFNRSRFEVGMIAKPTGDRKRKLAGRIVDLLPAIALGAFFLVILRADVLVANKPQLAYTVIPLAIFALMAIPRLPWIVVAAVSIAGLAAWVDIGWLAIYSLVPIAILGIFWVLRRFNEHWLAGCAIMLIVLLCVVMYEARETAQFQIATRYVSLLANARTRELQGQSEKAREWRREASTLPFTRSTDIQRSISELHNAFGLDLANVFAESEIRNKIDLIIKFDPLWAEPRAQRIAFITADGDFEKAVAECRQLIALQPRMGQHHALLGYVLLRKGLPDDAKIEFEAARSFDKTEREATINLALIAAADDNRSEARRLLRPTVWMGYRHPMVRRILRRLDESLAPIEISIDLIAAPKGMELLAAYVTAKEAHSPSERLELLRRAVHYAPEIPSICMRYGDALWDQAMFAECFTQFEETLRAARSGRGRITKAFIDRAVGSLVKVLSKLVVEHRRRGQSGQADALLHRALQVLPPDQIDDVMRLAKPAKRTTP